MEDNNKTFSAINVPNKIENYLVANKWYISIGIFWFLGLLLAFTPCVFPLLLMMVSLLGGGVTTNKKSRVIGLSLTYVFSLSLTYALAGIIVCATGIYIQAFMQNVWIISLFGILFLLLAAALLDIFTLKLPAKWQHVVIHYNNFRSASNYLGVALMGVLATLIASPCLAAPLIGVLSYVGQSGSILFAAITLFFMGLGIGTPLIIATIIGVNVLPKSGFWQEHIRTYFGIVMLGIAIWLFSRVLPETSILFFWAALAFYTAIYLGVFSFTPTNNIGRFGKVISLIILIYGFVLMIGGFMGESNPLNPLKMLTKQTQSEIAQFTIVNNLQELKQQFERSSKEHKLILLDFYADWCASCRAFDKNVLSNPEVQNILANEFMMLRIDMTNPEGESTKLAKSFNVYAPPRVLFFNENNEQMNIDVSNDMPVRQFIEILNDILNGKIAPIVKK